MQRACLYRLVRMSPDTGMLQLDVSLADDVGSRRQVALKQDGAQRVRVLPHGSLAIEKASLQVASRSFGQTLCQRRALFEGPDRCPQRALHLVCLFGIQGPQAKRVSDVA